MKKIFALSLVVVLIASLGYAIYSGLARDTWFAVEDGTAAIRKHTAR
ncbi:MAG: hypothetical protein RLZZ373_322 [Pseudomonadota bacterium]|jgi:hypothetical protein